MRGEGVRAEIPRDAAGDSVAAGRATVPNAGARGHGGVESYGAAAPEFSRPYDARGHRSNGRRTGKHGGRVTRTLWTGRWL
jgi:hypothetical protein